MKNLALWTIQVMLALLFFFVGTMKLATPYEALAASADWVGLLPPWLVLAIGAAEVAGAIGVVLPAATGVGRLLTPLAAAGLALIMVLATLFLVSVGQAGTAPPNLVILALALTVVYGRRADLGGAVRTARLAP